MREVRGGGHCRFLSEWRRRGRTQIRRRQINIVPLSVYSFYEPGSIQPNIDITPSFHHQLMHRQIKITIFFPPLLLIPLPTGTWIKYSRKLYLQGKCSWAMLHENQMNNTVLLFPGGINVASFCIPQPEAQLVVPDWGDKVDYGIGLSYRSVRLHRLAVAGRYENPMP
jgi:hypothetical protein